MNAINPEFFVPFNWNYFVGMLYILLLLHVYWYVLFLYMGYSFFASGEPQDLQNQVGGEASLEDLIKMKEQKKKEGEKDTKKDK